MNIKRVVKELEERGSIGLDLSPGDPLCEAAALKLRQSVLLMQEFVDRVEAGEVQSRYTYGKFKELLASE